MRPPTRSTRSVRPSLNSNNARRSRSAPGPSSSHPVASQSSEANNVPPKPKPKPKPKPQPIITTATATAADAKVTVDSGTLPESDPAPHASAPVVSCFPVLSPSTFIYENENECQSHSESLPLISPSLSVAGSIILGKPPRPRHRMSSDKLETLAAFFRRNTHPSRKEKEAICKDLDMDLKTVTTWFQNKRQTLARSKRQLSSEGSTTPTAAMDMLASASATMSPLVAAEKPSASLASVPVQPDSVAQRSCTNCPFLGQSTSRPQRATSGSCDTTPKSHLQALSAVTHDPNIFVFESVRTKESPSSCVSSFPDLRKHRLGGDRSIHPEDLWKHIPSSPAQPALSSPDVSPNIGTPSRSSRLSVQRPRTLEWACARSAKRRRTSPDTVYHEDGETDSECNPIDGPDVCRSSFSISEARGLLGFYDKYPSDVVHGAILLLGLRDAAVDLEI